MLPIPRCTRAAWMAGLVLLLAGSIRAEEKLPVERTINDRQIIDLLADVHERGRVLYNAGDFAGCYRLFEGSLVTVRPLLPQDMQQMIAVGIPDAERQSSMARRAMLLHELVEALRVKLRPTAGPAAEKLTKPRPVPAGGPKGDPKFDLKIGPEDKPKVPEDKPKAPESKVKGLGQVEGPPPPVRLPTLGTPTKGTTLSETAEPTIAEPKPDAKAPGGNHANSTRPVDLPPPISLPEPMKEPKQPEPPPAIKPKDTPKPAPPIVIGGDPPKLDPPPLISPKDVAPTSPAPPSQKLKDDGKQSPPPIVIPIPDGK
jgi:hypothetical protein